MSPARQGAIVFVSIIFFACGARAEDRAELEALRARIDRLRAEIAGAEDTRSEAREELRESERAISSANRTLRELSARRLQARSALATLAARKNTLEAEIAARGQELGKLLAAMYLAGEPGRLELLLSGEDPNQTARKLYYFAHVSRAYASLIQSMRDDLARVKELEVRTLEKSAEVALIERSQKSERGELLKQQSARRKLLARISERVRTQRREVRSLERDESRLSRLVEELGRVITAIPLAPRNERLPELRRAEPGLSGSKGGIRVPTKGVIAHRFGAPRTEGGPNWKGLFIRAVGGEEVRAVAGGRVVFADWMRGLGNLLILDHGQGYLSIYGNNESVLKEVGEEVRTGEVVATVGATGGSQETGLYFELRHEGKPIDPSKWVGFH